MLHRPPLRGGSVFKRRRKHEGAEDEVQAERAEKHPEGVEVEETPADRQADLLMGGFRAVREPGI
jgi:hypothetical protein